MPQGRCNREGKESAAVCKLYGLTGEEGVHEPGRHRGHEVPYLEGESRYTEGAR